MTDNKKKPQPPLYLDMDWNEALRRFAQTDPSELPDKAKKPRKKRGGTKPPPSEIDGKDQDR
ncbi:MAG: hypothetical protein RIC36_16655 [Rhodospirillales bacterium]